MIFCDAFCVWASRLISSSLLLLYLSSAASVDAQGEKPTSRDIAPEVIDQKLPEYRVDLESVSISSVAAARRSLQEVVFDNVLISEHYKPFERRACMLSGSDLIGLTIQTQLVGESAIESQTEEGYINLWTVGQVDSRDARGGVLAAFTLVADDECDRVLSVGADFGFTVAVSGEPLFARAGYRSFKADSDLIAIHLKRGKNIVVICFFTPEGRGASDFTHRWISRIAVYRDRISALKSHRINNAHFLDFPVAASLDDLRVSVGPPFYSQASFCSLDGEELVRGVICPNGAIIWAEDKTRSIPREGVIRIDNEMAEPVVLADIRTIDALMANFRSAPNGGDPHYGWRYRAYHLLKEEFRSLRSGVDWQRKFALAVAGSNSVDARNVVTGGRHSSLRLLDFVSRIDGSLQSFLYYEPSNFRNRPNAETASLMVVVPGVSNPVRPFLESATFAGLENLEDQCALAEEYGISLLWPGYNDIDFGGDVSQGQLKEAIEKYCETSGRTPELYLFGCCSAGIATTRFVVDSSASVAGYILYSPLLKRNDVYRFAPGLVESELSPTMRCSQDDLETLADNLRHTPACGMYDSAMPGHGNRADFQKLIDLLQEKNADFRCFSFTETTEYTWGERLKARVRPFFAWIYERGALPLPKCSLVRSHDARRARSMRGKLFSNGFYLVGADRVFQELVGTMNGSYKRWRGAELPTRSPNPQAIELRLISIRRNEDPKEVLPMLKDKLPPESKKALFGMFVDEATIPSRVVIFYRGAPFSSVPIIDPFLDGEASGCVWQQDGGAWREVSSW